MISAMLGALWVRLVPLAGPVLRFAVPWLMPVARLFSGAAAWLWPAAIVAVAALVLWWSVSTIFRRDPGLVSLAAVDRDRLAAENQDLKRAVAQYQATLAERDREVSAERAQLDELTVIQEASRHDARTALPSLTDPILPADNPWLRAKRGRR